MILILMTVIAGQSLVPGGPRPGQAPSKMMFWTGLLADLSQPMLVLPALLEAAQAMMLRQCQGNLNLLQWLAELSPVETGNAQLQIQPVSTGYSVPASKCLLIYRLQSSCRVNHLLCERPSCRVFEPAFAPAATVCQGLLASLLVLAHPVPPKLAVFVFLCQPPCNLSMFKAILFTAEAQLIHLAICNGMQRAEIVCMHPGYKYREVVRRKDEREALQGFDCENCKRFYQAITSWGPIANLPTPACGHAVSRKLFVLLTLELCHPTLISVTLC